LGSCIDVDGIDFFIFKIMQPIVMDVTALVQVVNMIRYFIPILVLKGKLVFLVEIVANGSFNAG
jgi:hypothetical protein